MQSAGGEANRILLASALSSMRIICPNKVRRRDWIIAVSLGCFVSLRTSPFRTNWYHLMSSSIRRHHWSSASILRASVLDIAQQSEPYRNIGKMHVLYSLNFTEMASHYYVMQYINNNSKGYNIIVICYQLLDLSSHFICFVLVVKQCND